MASPVNSLLNFVPIDLFDPKWLNFVHIDLFDQNRISGLLGSPSFLKQ